MTSSPSAVDVDAVLALLDAATATDGVRPVSEDAELRLRHGSPGGHDLVVHDDGALAGYARYDDGAAELVVHPDHRRRGLGRALLRQLLDLAGDRPLNLWAHGDLPGSAALLRPHGFTRARVLLQMRLPDLAAADLDQRPALPDGVQVLPFSPGRDEEAWVRVNSRAFAWHPEQGRMTRQDLERRETEPWFDPDGFLMAWRGEPGDDGVLLGSHWTKVHPSGDVADEPVGEIYVLGIDPDAQGMALGRALTDLGLVHLRERGLRQVLLYVEEDNTAAVRLYESRGFRRFAVDVAWHRAPAREVVAPSSGG
ncbi:mycothiol synthase [Blastococcus tunisiensis]|uniref:Mycothiol acetyltransferase n=1 Tax=Blastococcus tunisiensis TaxID=1798228 RepID=A0A1I2K244_9ACTN|nr:mycothiol synthase [Blastococcus sp. DSM 46838]SFF59277.1 mycothiol synthase [Blastococcus sp. DSM 46838]